MNTQNLPFWSLSTDRALDRMHSTAAGLSQQDAKQRLSQYGANSLAKEHKSNALTLLINQFKIINSKVRLF